MMTTLTRSTTSTSLRRTLRNSPMVSPLLRQIDSLLEKAIGGRATPIVPTSADPKQIIYIGLRAGALQDRSEEHTSELQSHHEIVCRLLLEKKKSSRTKEKRERRNLDGLVRRRYEY